MEQRELFATGPAPEDAAAWVGWVRVGAGAPWQAAEHADTEDLCWVLLLAWEPHVKAAHTDRMALPRGRHPDDRRRPQRRKSR
jgi:hypothetical protein